MIGYDSVHMSDQSRRQFLAGAAGLVSSLSIEGGRHQLAAASSPQRITDVILDVDHLHKWDNSNGDTWDPFWADDDNLYAFNCDGRGFGKLPRNLAFNRLTGTEVSSLAGDIVNTMDEYGDAGKKEPDNGTWKVCGQECIDSVFYAFVSRNVYGKDSGDYWLRQTAFNSSLIKSTDRGLTWSPRAADNYRRPMWPGPAFGAPFFIHYGKNGGNVKRDGADRYVYAASTNGFWNDGDRYVLGRVPRTNLPDLHAADWTYFSGGDGQNASNWSTKVQDAKPLLEQRTHCGQSGPCFIPSLGLYLTIAWYNTQKMTKWFEPNEIRYDFYQAPHPWGPWTPIRSYSDQFLSVGHMYGPSLCAKFQHAEGSDVHMSLFTSGCQFEDVPSGLYKAWEIPIIVRTAALLRSHVIPSGDPKIAYRGVWSPIQESTPLPLGEPAVAVDPAHQTSSAEATAEFEFEGCGVDLIADKSAGFGSVDVFINGTIQGSVGLGIQNLPRLRGVTVFRSGKLAVGAHRIRIVSKTSSPVVLQGFQVYTESGASR